MVKIIYLPLALKDLREITDYIYHVLKAPKAAIDFVDALDHAIAKLEQFPYAVQSLETEYRLLQLKNYLVFYVVTEKEVEIHRIVYAKINLERVIR